MGMQPAFSEFIQDDPHRFIRRPALDSERPPSGHFPTKQAALKCVYLAVMNDLTETARRR
jgi:hypothetical protein